MPDYLDLIAHTKNNLALLLSDRGEHGPAVEEIEDALERGREALELAPGRESAKQGLASTYQNLFWILYVAGSHREIAERVGEVPELQPDQAVPYWRIAATALAYCAENAGRDQALDETEREWLIEEYVDRMAEHFYAMAERGYADPAYLEREWFDAVRDHPRVVALARELAEWPSRTE